MPLDPTTLTGELESLDSEVAVLQQRRRLVAELLATFTDVLHGAAPLDLDASGFAIDPPKPPAPKAPSPEPLTKWNYVEVAEVAKALAAAGEPVNPGLEAHYGVNVGMGAYLVKQCRSRGLLPRPEARTKLVAEPITRAPFDPQATRDAAAAIAQPDNGKGRWQPEVRPRPEPATTPAPKYGPEVALAMIEGAA